MSEREFDPTRPLWISADGSVHAEASERIDVSGVRRCPREGLRVLVVDDHCDSAETLAQLLCLRGYRATYVCNGIDTLAAVLEQRPAVVLLDISMPDISGYELLRRLLADARRDDSVYFAITGHDAEADRLRSAVAGFCGHVVKPVDLDVLERLMHGALARQVAQAPALGGADVSLSSPSGM